MKVFKQCKCEKETILQPGIIIWSLLSFNYFNAIYIIFWNTWYKIQFVLGLIWRIFEFLFSQRLIWFEIKKKNIPQVSSLYPNFNLCQTTMQIHLNNMGFWEMNDQFFIPTKVMAQKMWNSVGFILIIVVILQTFYRFLVIIILELQPDKILRYLSVSR